MLAKDIMTSKVITVKKDASIKEIAQVLTTNAISGVPVVDDDGKIIGVVSNEDLIYKDVDPKIPTYIEVLGGIIFLEGIKHYEEELKKLLANKAEDIMTSPAIVVDEDTDIKEIASIMVERGINRVPVVKESRVVGIVSRGDIVKSLLQ